MKRKLIHANKNYDSMLLTIPKFIVETLDLVNNRQVDVTLKGDKIVVEVIKEKAE